MSSKKIITLDNLSAFKDKCDETYQPIGNYQPAGNYQPLDADLTSIAGLSGTSGLLKKTASNTWSLDTNTYATQSYVDTAISNLPEPMVFKGTLGSNGTITSLPTASSSNEGYTYKVTTDGTYASQSAKVGDVFVCAKTGTSSYSWIYIPAGDDVEDTWRPILVNGTQLLGSAISTGGVNYKNGSNVTITGSGNDITIASSYTDTNQKIKQGTVTFGNDDVINFVGGGNITITGNATNKTMTLGVSSGFKIPTTTKQSEWDAKQDALSTYTAHTTAVGSATAIPVIKTNSYGQVTDLTSVSVSIPDVDQTYNASSTNAQSGTAVAGAIANMAKTNVDNNFSANQTFGSNSIIFNDLRVSEDTTHPLLKIYNSPDGVTLSIGIDSSRSFTWAGETYYLHEPVNDGTIALVEDMPSTTTSVTSGSSALITSGAVFTALGLNSGETGLIEATPAEINALFA